MFDLAQWTEALAVISGLEWFAAGIGVLAVWLTARQNIWCWPTGLVMVLLYTWIFFSAKLYANMALQLVFAGAQIYGWWHWRSQAESISPKHLSVNGVVLGMCAGILGSVLIGFFLKAYTDASAPWWDASLTAFSLVAQFWMARKFIQCWPLWVVIDVLYVWLFIQQALPATAILYGIFTLLAVHGWRSWRHAAQ